MKKILIANRGEIAVRIIRSIRDLGLQSVSIYDQNDWQSLHVRLSDECYAMQSGMDKVNEDEIIELAKKINADAIHPGYGFLAEKADFAGKCADAGIIFIGPSPEILSLLQDRLTVLELVKKAGIPTPKFLNKSFFISQGDEIVSTCETFGYPLIFQARFHQLGRSIWFIDNRSQAIEMLGRLRQKQPDLELFIEQKFFPVHLIRVPVLSLDKGTPIIFNEVDSSIHFRNRRLIEESPSPILAPTQRETINRITLEAISFFKFTGLGTFDYLVDAQGNIFFSKIKPYLPGSHMLNEISTGMDLVTLQIMHSAGLEPGIKQEDVLTKNFSLLCRISAVDPNKNFLPNPGMIRNFRLPAGPFVRCDTHITNGYQIPEKYDPILAKISVSSKDRNSLLSRMSRVLSETSISGITTDLPVSIYILNQQAFINGSYHTDFLYQLLEGRLEVIQDIAFEEEYRNFAVATATAYYFQRKSFRPIMPDRVKSSWHQESRKP
jgi:acetyl-CoA carboxylase, biotin carboxylase subunit